VAHKNEMLVGVKETLNSLRKEHVKASIRVEEQSKEIDMLRHHVRFILLHSVTTTVLAHGQYMYTEIGLCEKSNSQIRFFEKIGTFVIYTECTR
jgi:hypothetical protein